MKCWFTPKDKRCWKSSRFDVFQNELELKLKKEMRPMPVFVIDHIEELRDRELRGAAGFTAC